MRQYLNLMKKILISNKQMMDRTGTGTYYLFGKQIEFDLSEGFPLLTTKKIHFKSVVAELLWMISGSTNVKPLQEQGVRIWNEWCNENGDLGPIYGKQLRNAGATRNMWVWPKGADPINPDQPKWFVEYENDGVDQLSDLIEGIKTDPFSRRHIMTMWAPKDLPHQRLACCHGTVTQFNVNEDNTLDCHMYQRSCDVFLGLPFNVASYALLTHMIAQQTNLIPGQLIISFGNVHIYKNHLEQVDLQLTREPKELPRLILQPKESIFDYRLEDISLEGYDPHPAIKAPVSV